MTQEELENLKQLLDKAKKVLDLCDVSISVWFDNDLKEFILYGEDSREGVRRIISSQGIKDDYM